MSRVRTSNARSPCPPGCLAWRQYRVKLLSDDTATLGFSLADPQDWAIARMMRARDASHLGLLIVLDDPGSREDVVLWFQQATSLTLVAQSGDIMIGDEMRCLLPRYFAVFFDDIKDLAPELAAIKLAVRGTGDKTLH